MSKIRNGGLDQYGAEPFDQRQFGTVGVEGVKAVFRTAIRHDKYTIISSGSIIGLGRRPQLALRWPPDKVYV